MATTATSGTGILKRYNIGRLLVGLPIALLLLWLLYTILRQGLQNPTIFGQQMLTGLSKGAILAIIALGYTLVYGIIELINFAHGEVFMLGAFGSVTLIGLSGVTRNTPAGSRILILLGILLAVMCFTAFLNVSIERIAYRRLRNAPRLAPLISAIGVSFILQNLGLLWGKLGWVRGDTGALAGLAVFVLIVALGIWGTLRLNRTVQTGRRGLRALLWAVPLLLTILIGVNALETTRNAVLGPEGSPAREAIAGSRRIMGSSDVGPKDVPAELIPRTNLLVSAGLVGANDRSVSISAMDVLVIVISLLLMFGLYQFVMRSRAGKAMRATAQDRDAALLMGINVDKTIALAFLLGGALAGAGGLISAIYTTQAVFDMGFKAGLLAFTAAVLGGIGNVTGAMLGGFMIGLIQTLSDQYLKSQWTNAMIFGILVVILVFRPTGLLGEDVGQKA